MYDHSFSLQANYSALEILTYYWLDSHESKTALSIDILCNVYAIKAVETTSCSN